MSVSCLPGIDGGERYEMQLVKIANVLLEDTRLFHMSPLLYIRSSCGVCPADEGWMLQGPGHFDFTTFFNALTVCKYDEYTVSTGYRLHLELKGATARVTQTCVNAFDYYSRPQDKTAVCVKGGDAWSSVDLTLSYEPSDVMVGFVIETEGVVYIRNSYYEAQVDEAAIRRVEMVLSTTTFKKEEYILHNIELIRRCILASDEPIASHFRMYVVDNGRTLDHAALSGDGVTIYPNRNVGGAGGFSYGMIKAQEQPGITHILLMDDDVELSPESIKRTYSLLTIVNDEHVDALISGAMMSFDEPDIRWEDIGYMTKDGFCRSLKPPMRMSVLHDCVTSESFEPDTATWKDLEQRYAAWWYCCIPLPVIRNNGMPLPFFVRFDDVEYGMRCKSRIMTLNGICICHLAFFMRYNAAVERYQTARNGLIAQAVTGVAPLTNFIEELQHNVMIELMKFNYTDAELVLEGLEDFMRGPEWFSHKDVAERRFMDANKNREKLLPLADLRELVRDQFAIDLTTIGVDEIIRDIPLGGSLRGRVYNVTHAQLFERSLNGQLYGRLKPFASETAIIEAVGWSYLPGKLYGVDHIIAINIQSKSGIIRHRDNARARKIWAHFKDLIKRYKKDKSSLEASYAAARPWLTSVKYWKEYLDL